MYAVCCSMMGGRCENSSKAFAWKPPGTARTSIESPRLVSKDVKDLVDQRSRSGVPPILSQRRGIRLDA